MWLRSDAPPLPVWYACAALSACTLQPTATISVLAVPSLVGALAGHMGPGLPYTRYGSDASP